MAWGSSPRSACRYPALPMRSGAWRPILRPHEAPGGHRGQAWRLPGSRPRTSIGAQHPEVPWRQPMTGDIRARWLTLKTYLDDEIRRVAERFMREGAVQAMLCVHAGDFLSVVDRDVVIGYRDTAAKA